MTARQERLLSRLEGWFQANDGTVLDAANALQLPFQAASAVVGLGISAGKLVSVGDRILTEVQLANLADQLRERFASRPFHPRELRETLACSRPWADNIANTFEARNLLERIEGGWRLKQSP